MADKKRDVITQELIEREQLLAVGRLAAGIAHEINNPAAFVIANLNELSITAHELENLLRTALPLALKAAETTAETTAEALRQLMEDARYPAIFQDVQAMIQESQEGMCRIRDIVHNLRGFSIVDEGETIVDVCQVTRSTLELLRPELRHRARLTLELGPTPAVLAPRSRVAQVLMSLLLNALQGLEGQRRGKLAVTTMADAEGDAVVVIRDSGTPLPAALLANPDDPFAISRQEDGGLSLRLATSRGIIRRLGGTLEVASDSGGTVATLRLPAYRPTRHTQPTVLSRAERDPILDASLLIVDNERPIVRSLKRLFRQARTVMTATSGKEALEILRTAEPPDLILCDIIMPEMSGVELYQQLETERPELLPRFLFVTGGALTRDTRAFCERHAERVLEKPFEPRELRQRIRQMLLET